jgi:hypothetical protein
MACGIVIDVLTALGYSIVEAQRAVQSLSCDVTDVWKTGCGRRWRRSAGRRTLNQAIVGSRLGK